GALWNTFIFGGNFTSLIKLFPPAFDPDIATLRSALQADRNDPEALTRTYDRLTSVDFSQHVLATQTDQLHVLPLPSCGWWPVKPPNPSGNDGLTEARQASRRP